MLTKRAGIIATACLTGAFFFARPACANQIYKANNALPLNDPSSWEGGTVPGTSDVAVFDERVTTNTLSFLLTNDLAWAGVVFTNQTVAVSNAVGAAVLVTNGTNAAVLTLGSNGVSLAGSGLALTSNVPLALSSAQSWQLGRCNVTFGSTVSGNVDWVLDMSSQIVWNVASGYNGNLIVTNAVYIDRFCQTGRWAKTFSCFQSYGGTRWELAFTNAVAWSDLFSSRTASVNSWNGLTAGGSLRFETGDSFAFSGSRFTLDNGYVVQNGGALSGYEVQCQFSTYNARYTMNGGSLSLSSGLLIGNGLASLSNEGRFLQKGGTVSANSVKVGWSGGKYWGLNTFEVTGGVFRITGSRATDTGTHLSWGDNTGSGEASGLFLMEGGWADIDQVAFGRSMDGAAYSITNAFSMFKMTGGELVLGSRGLYAGRSWNNGVTNSGYQVKLQGGTLTAGDSWSSQLDVFLSDANGGTVFNTSDTNGVGQRVTLNGAVYGPGSLVKSGAGTLALAGAASYAGKTLVKAGTLLVGGTSASDCYRWTADSLTASNYAPVTAWADVNKSVPATNGVLSQTPLLIRNELNGHSVVRFNSGSSQYLTIGADLSPISGSTNFTMVIVFKTSTVGLNGNGYWYNNTGLLDAEQGGYQNDWGLAYSVGGQIGGGVGFYNVGDVCAYSTNTISVVDSQPHVAIFMWQGTNVWLNVDGRTSTAVKTGVTSVAARNAYRLLFGSMNLLGGQYFNGDMAEIRIYRNRVLTSDEQNQIGNALSAAYGVPGAVFAESTSVASPSGEVVTPSSSAGASLPYSAAVWCADTLTGTNGSAVSSWATTNGAIAATLAGAGASVTSPTLLTNAINGHSAVRFTASLKSGLGIAAGDSPIGGTTNFTVAFVFRTTTPGVTASQWYSSAGLIDAEQPGTANDWGIAFTGDGRVAGGIGNTDFTYWSKVFDLADGAPHAVVVSYNNRGGVLSIMVDGLNAAQSIGAHATPRSAYRIMLGSLNALSGQFFTGDLAAFRLYPECALTADEMTALSGELASTYGVRFVPRGNTLAPQPTGLGRGDVQIYSAAALVLPTATNSAVALVSGQTISGGGVVRGTLALNAGATVDIGLTDVLTMDSLWLSDGAAVRWHHAGDVGNTMSVEALKASGGVTVFVEGGADLPVRVPMIAYTSGENLDKTVWSVIGGKYNTRVEINAAAKTVDLVTPKGTMVVVR